MLSGLWDALGSNVECLLHHRLHLRSLIRVPAGARVRGWCLAERGGTVREVYDERSTRAGVAAEERGSF